MSFFEALMVICFGLAWPASIYKSYKSKSNKGKSLGFLFIVLLGYASGVLHKIFYSCDLVIALYLINSMMVIIDICIYFRNKAYDKFPQPAL